MSKDTRSINESDLLDLPSEPFSRDADTVLEILGVDPSIGLAADDVERRLDKFGPNVVETERTTSRLRMLLSQFTSIVVWLLIAAAAVAFITDSALEAIAILTVLVLNALIGFLIEVQADRALVALRHATTTSARVRRESREEVIDAFGLVPGDIIVVSAGDRVPADARIIEAASLRCDESSLTGESVATNKSMTSVELSTPLADRSPMIFLGTNVVAGRGVAVVTATGEDTEIGRIGVSLSSAGDRATPLERRLDELGKRLVYVVLGIAAIVMVAGVLRGDEIWLMARVAISLAVAAVPEGLPAVTTLILALGVLRMARRNAIVRKLAAVETLGSTTVICTDKTGTLTENQMTVQVVHLANDRRIELDGIPRRADSDPILDRLLRVGILCSEASFHPTQGKAVGDPTETALIHAAIELGMDPELEHSRQTKTSEIPFDASVKRMTSVFVDENGDRRAFLKGAPAVILKACTQIVDINGSGRILTDEARERLLKINEEMAGRAFRVLAFADRPVSDPNGDDLEGGFEFLGIVGMIDPPRPEVTDAIRLAKNAGIRIVMLTGDQLLTAKAIAKQLDLTDDHDVVALHSSDVAEADTERLAELAGTAHVFARVTPDDKFRIVEALQSAGEIVAVTGDGINDAPALKQADIGISMGMRGTDVAKEASDIILTDDNFSTIVRAIEGGRTIYANIVKFVHMMFSHNLGEVVVIFTSILLGLPLPLFPLQILWVNLVTDVFPAIALAVEPSTPETMNRGPRSTAETLLSGRMMFLIFWQGVLLGAIALGAYIWALSIYGEGVQSRTIALLSIVGVQIGHLFNCRSRRRSAFDGFFSNPMIFVAFAAVVGLQLIALYVTPLASVLGVSPPEATGWAIAGISILLPVAIVEMAKLIARYRTSAAAD